MHIPFFRAAAAASLFASFAPQLRADTYLIDFGISNTPPNAANGSETTGADANGNYWNNVTSTSVGFGIGGGTGLALTNLVSTANAPSSIGVVISSGWKSSGINSGGLNQATPALGIYGIQTATQDYYYVEAANGTTTATQTVTINNLDPAKYYDLTMFGTRNATAAPLVRGTQYSVTDANGPHTTVLQISGTNLGGTGYNGNNSTTAPLTGLKPSASGTLVLNVSNFHDAGIYAANQFGYLGLLALKETAAPVALPAVRFDFGISAANPANGTPTASPDVNGNYWNNVTSDVAANLIAGGTGLTLSNPVTATNVPTPYKLALGTGWKASGKLNGGLLAPTAARLGNFAIGTATEDYYYVEGAVGTTSTIQISGLSPVKLYSFKFFGTRSAAGVRRTTYAVVSGSGTVSGTLQTTGTGLGNGTGGADGNDTYDGNNRSTTLLQNVQTGASGEATVQVSVAEGGFAHLGIMEIVEGATVPPLGAVVPNVTGEVNRWVAQDALDPVAPGSLLFVGSSSIRRWESLTRNFADYRITQRGYGGTQFADLIADFDKIVLPYQPAAIVVFEGTNDIRLSHKSGETVFADFQTFVGKVRAVWPAVPVCMLGITPVPSFFNDPGDDPKRRTANSLIKSYCESDPTLNYIDCQKFFEDLHDAGTPEGTAAWLSYFVDDTHLNRAGYAQWLSVIRPALLAITPPDKSFAANPSALVAGEKLLFDFGPRDAATGDDTVGSDANGFRWNNWHGTNGGGLVNSGEHLANLVKTSGANSAIRMTVTGGYNATGKAGAGGLLAPAPALLGDLAVETATEDFWYSSANDINDGTSDDSPGGFMLGGLDPNLQYEFRFLGSRANDETRVTEYKIYGANVTTTTLQTSGTGIGSAGGNANNDEVAVLAGIRPDAFGQVFIDQTLLQGAFAYINAMEITASAAASAYQTWRAGYFTPQQLAEPALEATVYGSNADPDGDGRANLLEYAAGTNPIVSNPATDTGAMETVGPDRFLTLTFRKNLAATDLAWQVETSADLATWTDVTDSLVTTGQIETRRASVPAAGFPTRFLRLRVRLTGP